MFAPGSGAMSAHEEWSALDLAARCEKALALQHLVALCSTSGALAIRGLDSPCCVPAAPPPRRKAWVTLLTNAPYARGAVALAHSLSEAESQFPLIVLVTDGVPEVAPLVHTSQGASGGQHSSPGQACLCTTCFPALHPPSRATWQGGVLRGSPDSTSRTMFRPYDWRTQAAREQCVAAGCEVREVVPLPLPPGVGGPPSYACEHFAECWSKLRVWELEDERGQQVDIVASRQRCSSPPPPLLPLLGLALPRQGRSSPPLPRETGTVALVAALRTLEERPLRSAPNGRPGQHSLFQGARRPQPRPSLRSLRVVTARVWAALLLLSILLRWPGSSSSCCSTPT